MDKIKVAVVGYGNIGKYSLQAVKAASDMELAGVVRRKESVGKKSPELEGVKVVSDISELGKVDVAILAVPSREIPVTAKALVEKGISTVDSFDIHGKDILDLYKSLDAACKKSGAKAIISAGWDPGTDSLIRTVLLAMAPKGLTYTNFGPGMSMGHSVVARSKKGVKDALSMTIPLGTGVHRRDVYVQLEDGADFKAVENAIKTDSYFCHDDTHVHEVSCVNDLRDMGHGVLLERKGVSGETQNQRFQFTMQINNPALTGQVLASCARAVVKQQPGCYTLPQIAPYDLVNIDLDEFLLHTV
ncbi:MAG: diaminopimelate dehydrogenase [Bacteroidales bacterium]|nr:diaminopimelate dehydrogenase [Bacteroidales bacterium]MBQ5538694.1 diaminopimelate dehydrogenase [Bacteroidales bacterium]MEE3448818.1 diaminopimelate dehydrogenase [Bacteroidales bacterium]